jgi:diguanylate cyclase (GGDEF)-like protein
LGDASAARALRSLGAGGHRRPHEGAGPSADLGDPPLPLNETLANVALLIVGMLLGALGFSLVVGRHRARQLAKLTDSLAEAAGMPDGGGRSVRVPDRVLSSSFDRLQKRIAEVEAMATTDQLTRLLNRLACLQVLSTEIERANRYDRQLAVALIDIDHFKRINDTHGHAVGDACLGALVRILTAELQFGDKLGRLGGEEFLVLLPETDARAANKAAEKMRANVAATGVTISVGWACWEGEDADDLLRRADDALYAAKAHGRNCVKGAPATLPRRR